MSEILVRFRTTRGSSGEVNIDRWLGFSAGGADFHSISCRLRARCRASLHHGAIISVISGVLFVSHLVVSLHLLAQIATNPKGSS